MKQFIYLVLILIITSACKEVYDIPPQAMLQASYYNSATENKISPNITAWGVGAESFLLKDTTVQVMLFPLSNKDTTIYLISLDSSIDTITFIHENEMKYASMESGFYYEYKLRSISHTNNRIENIQITDSLVTKKWHENIKLYLLPLPAGSN